MEENKEQVAVEFAPPKKQISMLRTERFAKVFTNMVFTCGPIILLLFLSVIILPVFQLFLAAIIFIVVVCMVVFTLGSIFAIENNPIGPIWNFLGNSLNMEYSAKIVEFCMSMVPYICAVGLVLSGLAITLLSVSRAKGRTGRIVAVSIIAGLIAIALVLYFVMGGALWQS